MLLNGNSAPARSTPLFAICLLTALASTQVHADDFDRLRQKIDQVMVEKNYPSVAIALGLGGQIVFQQAWGYSDLEQKIPATPQTAYSLASISKTYTGVAMMLLADRGVVDLDKPINDYLGTQKLQVHIGNAEDVTVRRVLNHTAGLPLHFNFFYEDFHEKRPPMEESIREFGHVMFSPGERFNYSNFGYGLLDHVIETQTGSPYAAFLSKEVFGPLGMRNSFGDVPPAGAGQVAVRYDPNGKPVSGYDFDHRGASSVFASAEDLARFGLFILGTWLPKDVDLLAPTTRDKMVAIDPRSRLGNYEVYGLGINVRRADGNRFFSHSGSMPGVSTSMTLAPDHGAVVAVLINSSAPGTLRSLFEIRDLAFSILFDVVNKPSPDATPGAAPIAGQWQGRISTIAGGFKLRLEADDAGTVAVALGDGALKTAVSVENSDSGLYTIIVPEIQIPTPSAMRYTHGLVLNICAGKDGALSGSATAYGDPAAVPERSALSYWVELRPAPESK